jgi:hypothetical protein
MLMLGKTTTPLKGRRGSTRFDPALFLVVPFSDVAKGKSTSCLLTSYSPKGSAFLPEI